MSPNRKSKTVLIITSLAFGLLFVTMILGAIFPGNVNYGYAPWFVWVAIFEAVAFLLVVTVIGITVQKNNRHLRDKDKNK